MYIVVSDLITTLSTEIVDNLTVQFKQKVVLMKTPVLIVGAGPTGLTMAVELKRHGIPFRIIDKQTKPVITSNALAAQTRTLELWDDEGLLPTVLNKGAAVRGINIYSLGEKILHLDLDNTILETPYPFVLGIAQHQTEAMLLEHLTQHNIQVEMNVELTTFTEKPNEIIATLRHSSGEIEHVNTQWLIACDGAHSAIRTQCNMAFSGQDLAQHFILADLKITTELLHNELHIFFSADGPLLFIRFNEDTFRIIADVSKDARFTTNQPPSFAQIQELIHQRYPYPIQLAEPIWTSSFWIHERIMSSFKVNNIFFAGDAAHIHSPVGGQGMNTGIQDAYNLAWKLALVINNKAYPAILESYQAERYPFAKSILRGTTFLTRFITLHNKWLCKLRNVILTYVLKSKHWRKKIFSTMTQLNIHYKNSALITDVLNNEPGPKAGTRMLSLPRDNNIELINFVRGPQHSLLIFLNSETELAPCLQLKETIEKNYPGLMQFILISTRDKLTGWNETIIEDKEGKIHQQYQAKQPMLYLIRPDKYIGFRSTLEQANELMTYLKTHFIKS